MKTFFNYLTDRQLHCLFLLTMVLFSVSSFGQGKLEFDVTHATCPNKSNGKIELKLKGSGDYDFEWSNGETTKDIDRLAPGEYSVKIFDKDSCVAEGKAEVKFKEKDLKIVGGDGSNSYCKKEYNNSELILTAVSDCDDCTYEWSTGETGKHITIKPPKGGEYTVKMTTKDTCIYEAYTFFNIKIVDCDKKGGGNNGGGGGGGGGGNSRYGIPVIGSRDPNDIIGPIGYGSEKWVSVNDVLPYTIRFENDPIFATAPARDITIISPLDSIADLLTFELQSFGFANMLFDVPAGTNHFKKRYDLQDSLGLLIDVTAGVDVTTRNAFWIFESINPETGLPVENPLLGMLPINDSTHRGEGFVSYNIQSIATVNTGDTLTAFADIVFDENEALLTPSVTNLIDALPPATKMSRYFTIIDSTSLLLSWAGNDDLGGSGLQYYDVFVSENGDVFNVLESHIENTELTFSGTTGNTYSFYVLGIDNTGNKEEKIIGETTVVLGEEVPAIPDGLLATGISPSEINISWNDNSTNETGFILERSLSSNSGFLEIAYLPSDSTSYSDIGLSGSTTYYYRVLAGNEGGASAYSDIDSARTLHLPMAPSELIANALSSSVVQLNWDDNADNETGFVIERSLFSQENFLSIDTLESGTLSYLDSGLSASTFYYYRVKAFNQGGASEYSDEAEVLTTPLPPVNFFSTTISSSRIDLSWADLSDNESGFAIVRSFLPESGYTEIAVLDSNVTFYADTLLLQDTVYYYKIKATSLSGDSEFSTITSSRTLPNISEIPQPLFAVAASSNQIDLEWTDNSDNEQGFVLQRSLNPDSGFVYIAVIPENDTTYQDIGLLPNTNYYYKVGASNEGGISDFSNVVTAVTLPEIPVSPGNLEATGISLSKIQLTWNDNSDNEDRFIIERTLTPPGVGFIPMDTVEMDSSSFIDMGLENNKTYYYRVVAENISGRSTYSNIDSANTQDVIIRDEAIVCNAPENLNVTNIKSTMAELIWDEVDNAKAYEIRYRKRTSEWIIKMGLSNSIFLENLEEDERYEVQVKAQCMYGKTDFSSLTFSTLDCNNIPYEWIDFVSINEMVNQSGKNNGYGNFTNMKEDLTQGSDFELKLKAGFTKSVKEVQWNVWIDYNRDGNYKGEDELVANFNSKGTEIISNTIRVPNSAQTGLTKMRVEMHSVEDSESCGAGEIEDYTIEIFENELNTGESDIVGTDMQLINVYPNPVESILHLNYSPDLIIREVALFNIAGQETKGIPIGKNKKEINVSSLPTGVYMLIINSNKGRIKQWFVKK